MTWVSGVLISKLVPARRGLHSIKIIEDLFCCLYQVVVTPGSNVPGNVPTRPSQEIRPIAEHHTPPNNQHQQQIGNTHQTRTLQNLQHVPPDPITPSPPSRPDPSTTLHVRHQHHPHLCLHLHHQQRTQQSTLVLHLRPDSINFSRDPGPYRRNHHHRRHMANEHLDLLRPWQLHKNVGRSTSPKQNKSHTILCVSTVTVEPDRVPIGSIDQ